MEPILFEEQHFLDINWYFADYYNRLCIAASGGGILPSFLSDQQSRNDEFHEIVIDLKEQFASQRNENVANIIVDLNSNEDLKQYFSDFESLAKRGFYVYDKINLNDSTDTNYVLVAYPVYDTRTDPYPIDPMHLNLIPKLNRPLISRTNSSFSNSNFTSKNLIQLLNKNYKWRQ